MADNRVLRSCTQGKADTYGLNDDNDDECNHLRSCRGTCNDYQGFIEPGDTVSHWRVHRVLNGD